MSALNASTELASITEFSYFLKYFDNPYYVNDTKGNILCFIITPTNPAVFSSK